MEYCRKSKELSRFIDNFLSCPAFSYERTVAALRLVIAALTDNERLSLVSGDLYYPVVQLSDMNDVKYIYNHLPNRMIGKVKIEGKEYAVIGGYSVQNIPTILVISIYIKMTLFLVQVLHFLKYLLKR